jgi:hypothetical protein
MLTAYDQYRAEIFNEAVIEGHLVGDAIRADNSTRGRVIGMAGHGRASRRGLAGQAVCRLTQVAD